MTPDDAIRIRHMIEAAQTAQRFVEGRRRADLDTDKMLLFAVVQAIQIIGEAASRISSETRATTPFVPWARIVGMRNRLVHAYDEIDHVKSSGRRCPRKFPRCCRCSFPSCPPD